MIVLGFDTATAATAVALQLPDGSHLQRRDDPAPGARPGHATRLLAMARELLAEAGVAWREVERVAVGLGPGTFTGLRVGVASARGLAQSLGCELVGISTPRALAQAVFDERVRTREAAQSAPPPTQSATERRVLAVIDARRGEVFAAAYAGVPDGEARELLAPCALAPHVLGELPSRLAEDPGAGRSWLAVGDGALRFRAELEAQGLRVASSPGLHLVSAAAVCDLGARARTAVDGAGLLPDYRRRPDAELALSDLAGAARRG